MRATEFEFSHRLLIIMAIFVGGFWCGSAHSLNVATMFAHWLMGHPVEPGIVSDRHAVQTILL